MNEEDVRGWASAIETALAGDENTDLEALWNEVTAAVDRHPDHAGLRRLRARLAKATYQHAEHHADLLALHRIEPDDRAAFLELILLQHRWAFLLVDEDGESSPESEQRQTELETQARGWLATLIEQYSTDPAFCAEVFARWDESGMYFPWLRLRLTLVAAASHPDEPMLMRALTRAWEELANQAPEGYDTAGSPPMGFLYDAGGMLWDPFLQERALASMDGLIARFPDDTDILTRRARLLEARCAFDEAASAYLSAQRAAERAAALTTGINGGDQTAGLAAEMHRRALACSGGRAAVVQAMADDLTNAMETLDAAPATSDDTNEAAQAFIGSWRTWIESFEDEIESSLGELRQAITDAKGPDQDELESMQGLAHQLAGSVLASLQLTPLNINPVNESAFESDWTSAAQPMRNSLRHLGWQDLGWVELPDFRDLFGHQVVSSVWLDPAAVSVALVTPLKGWTSLDLDTELEDGRFIVTAGCRGRNFLTGGPDVDTLFIEPNLDLNESCALHAARVAWTVARTPGAVLRRQADLAAVVAMQERARQHKTRFRLAEGLTPSEALGVPHDYPEVFAPMLRLAVRDGLRALQAATHL